MLRLPRSPSPGRDARGHPMKLYSVRPFASCTAGALRLWAAVFGTLVRPNGQHPDAGSLRPTIHALTDQIAHS